VFPSYLNDWDNFILACPTCNQTKGDKPSKEKLRDEVFKNISPFDPAPDRNIF
jgi:5-methylcytosine-specific restriction endonuclease McrA